MKNIRTTTCTLNYIPIHYHITKYSMSYVYVFSKACTVKAPERVHCTVQFWQKNVLISGKYSSYKKSWGGIGVVCTFSCQNRPRSGTLAERFTFLCRLNWQVHIAEYVVLVPKLTFTFFSWSSSENLVVAGNWFSSSEEPDSSEFFLCLFLPILNVTQNLSNSE